MKDWAVSFIGAASLIAFILWCIKIFWWAYAS